MARPSFDSVGSTSPSLIERVRQRDEEAWSRLVRLYGPLVGFWIRRKVVSRADADDIFQEVFRSVANGIDGFRKDRPGDSFRAWLRVITRNKVNDHFRRAGKQPVARGGTSNLQMLHQHQGVDSPESGDSQDDDPAEATALQELRLRGLELIHAEFEDRTWQMFAQVAIEGRAAKDVAVDFGVSPSAVRLHKSRVLKRLREELGDLEM